MKEKDGYKVIVKGDSSFQWYHCEHKDGILPNQGWKIHISANLSNAVEIHNLVVPYLVHNKLSFKHPFSNSDLQFLNSGKGGITQVGKFLTIYFENAEIFKIHIVNICKLFNRYFSVPFIITDKRYDNRLPVFYRYGAINGREVQNEMGIYETTIFDTNGRILVDKRENTFLLPNDITDPFKDIGSINSDYSNRYLSNKYVTVEKVSDTYKAETYLGIDLQKNTHCFVKISKPDVEIENNIYSQDLLQNECRILALLNHKSFPKLYDVFSESNRVIVVTSLITGLNLYDFIRLNAIQGIFISNAQTKKIFLSILNNIKQLEEIGIIHNDLKPNNIIINKKLETSLIDFETSFLNSESNKKKSSIKTRGYYNKQDSSNPDYYSLGMILYFIQTGYNISDAPRENNILERPLHYLTGKVNPDMEYFILNLCSNHYHAIDKVIEDFSKIIENKLSIFKIEQSKIQEISKTYSNISRNVVNWLFDNCIEDGELTYWNSSHVFNSGNGRTDINIGSSGILIFISYFFLTTNRISKEHINKFIYAIKFINTQKNKNQITGLFVGESGKVLATISSLLSLGKFNEDLIKPNIEYIKSNLPLNNDLFNGKSGVGLLFIILHILTKDKKHLETAIDISNKIINSSTMIENNMYWKDSQTQKHFLGFAHGISGIGYFLTLLYKFTSDEKLLKTIYNIADTLINNSMDYSKHSKLINWPNEPGENISNNYWCNGTSGISHFYLELYKVTKDEKFLSILNFCSNTIIKSSSFMNPTMCHGLAGNLNFLINYYQITKDKKLKSEIFRLSEVLKMSGVISDNYFLFPSESPYILTPDFWVGFTGTAYVFQRLTDIDNNFDFLSTEYYQSLYLRYENQSEDSTNAQHGIAAMGGEVFL
ncbi:lanthionine synthetase LanC family protein [Flavobacterium filum]|uniref:lanthionine synthetase LanC family protein n=1 Tax=Flavobacterium filum TaxID=370974 RepID=UPI0023F52CFE|nr:lanthionine synthetase LanC family protein [Flavobacterium filum]